jgi:hypothetical protein
MNQQAAGVTMLQGTNSIGQRCRSHLETCWRKTRMVEMAAAAALQDQSSK